MNFVQKVHAITDVNHQIEFSLPSLIPAELLADVVDVIR